MTTKWLSVHGGSVTMLPELKTLGETVPGDVFYPVLRPWEVWEYRRDDADGYRFMTVGSECDYEAAHVGTGREGQLVVVVHNTRLHLTETVAGSGGG